MSLTSSGQAFVAYLRPPDSITHTRRGVSVARFADRGDTNVDPATVRSFGEEWSRFPNVSAAETEEISSVYFDIVTDHMLRDAVVLDVGCGSGRFSRHVASRARCVEAVEPSAAALTAADTLADQANVRVTQASVGSIPFADASFEFVMAIGVLHHLPDTPAAVKSVVAKLKPGGHLLLYLYYALETRGLAYRSLFHASNVVRRVVSSLPTRLKWIVCDVIAAGVYAPFAAMARLTRPLPGLYRRLPLRYYSDRSWTVMRNDALDRFGTPLEQRFRRDEIAHMMADAGLVDVTFSEGFPFWHAVGRKP